MKSTLRKVFFLIAFLGSTALYAQTSQYYVVIGAFAKESNAKKFVGFAHSRFFGATYEKKPKSRLFFVYVIKTDNKEEAYTQVRILQKEATFSDAWVYRGSLIPVGSPPVTKVEPQPVIVEPVAVIDTIAVEEPVAVDSVAEVPTAVVLPIDTTSTVAIAPDINASALPPTKKAKGKYFKFAIIGPDGKPFPGKVHNVDLETGPRSGIV
jgi:hypothetical protein